MTDVNTAKAVALTLSVHTEDQAAALRAFETLGRIVMGFALDGMWASVSVEQVESEET